MSIEGRISEGRWRDFSRGALQALPIIGAYFVLAAPFGILTVKMGYSGETGIGMSFFVFAGAAQFLALQLVSDGAGLWTIFAATFVINLRHLLMSLSMGCHLERCQKRWLLYLAHTNTDETYGVNIAKEKPLREKNILGTNLISHLAWVLGTFAGVLAGPFLPWETKYFEALLPIMFAALLGVQIHGKRDAAAGLLAVLATGVLLFAVPGKGAFLIASVLIPTLMFFIREREPA